MRTLKKVWQDCKLAPKEINGIKKGVTEIFDSTTTTGYLEFGIMSLAGAFGIILTKDVETLVGILWIMIPTMLVGVIYVVVSIKVVTDYAKRPGALGVAAAGGLSV